jgi:hypothetical protein
MARVNWAVKRQVTTMRLGSERSEARLRTLVLFYVLCLLGTGTGHVVEIWHGGWLPYDFAPLPLNIYWTIADLTAAVLLIWRTKAGSGSSFEWMDT